ncbi:hypothetical protein [Flavisolibacter tropicus]|uniref:Uncharacterized protein n=1 Tax=Flavisolibacter tropicus TaxID=1492898 RepID=A0A172TZL1_9BACT|nr:hypothetical protein [Flavisolibacter tropicus]ANE52541.1 hypothetical protein SY85_20730 [Flavisolibacter tropicus]
MQKLTVTLFIFSFLLLGVALCVVPELIHNKQKEIIQLALFILACLIDIVALRHHQKHSITR